MFDSIILPNGEQFDKKSKLLFKMADKMGAFDDMDFNWQMIQNFVRLGLHKYFFAIGDQLTCNKGNEILTWDIIGIDEDTPADPNFNHSITLQLHYLLNDTSHFDAPEAAIYAENELAAGDYTFIYIDGNNYQFSINEPIPKGGQIFIKIDSFSDTLTNCKITTYAETGSDIPLETNIEIIQGTNGTILGRISALNVNGNCNCLQRIIYGSNRWKTSYIRQWLNNSGNAFWIPQTIFDRSPTVENGFLTNLDPDFKNVVGIVKKITSRSVTDGSGFDLDNERFFLISTSECGAVSGDADGTEYEFYKSGGSRIKYKGNIAHYYWTRTAEVNYASYVKHITPNANATNYYAKDADNISVVCCIC